MIFLLIRVTFLKYIVLNINKSRLNLYFHIHNNSENSLKFAKNKRSYYYKLEL